MAPVSSSHQAADPTSTPATIHSGDGRLGRPPPSEPNTAMNDTMVAGLASVSANVPAAIVSFIAVFGSLGGGRPSLPSPLWMVAGVLVGSAAWWLLLTGAIAYQRQRFTPAWRQRINRASALLLGGFALWQWGQLI